MVVSSCLGSEYLSTEPFQHFKKLSNVTKSWHICSVGRNVAAGMTGGLAYILDEDDTLIPKVSVNGF